MSTSDNARPYERIARDLRDRITGGELAPGDVVPSIRELVSTWGTSRVTVDRALGVLKSEGLIETRTGAPTKVSARRGRGASTPREHVERVSAGSSIYGPGETSRIYQTGVLSTRNVSEDVVNAVGLPVPDPDQPFEGSTIIQRARVMLRDGAVTHACTTWLNHPLIIQQPHGGPELVDRLCSTKDEDRFKGGTRKVVAELFGVDYTHTVERVGVRPVPTLVARELRVEPGTLMLWVLSTRWADEWPLEADECFYFPDDDLRYTYQ